MVLFKKSGGIIYLPLATVCLSGEALQEAWPWQGQGASQETPAEAVVQIHRPMLLMTLTQFWQAYTIFLRRCKLGGCLLTGKRQYYYCAQKMQN